MIRRDVEPATNRGNFTDALQLAHWMILDDALDEPAREIAIRAHVGLGERSAAVRVLQEYATVLNEEDSGQPSAHLAALLHPA
jgi:DNA-binding SARP family transcriptional activator